MLIDRKIYRQYVKIIFNLLPNKVKTQAHKLNIIKITNQNHAGTMKKVNAILKINATSPMGRMK